MSCNNMLLKKKKGEVILVKTHGFLNKIKFLITFISADSGNRLCFKTCFAHNFPILTVRYHYIRFPLSLCTWNLCISSRTK